MDEPRSTESPERIEIELTNHDASPRSRWRHPLATTELTPRPAALDDALEHGPFASGQPATAGGALGTERRRLIMSGLAVGALALVIGWAIGRAGGSVSDETSTDRTSATVPAPTQPSENVGEVPPTVDTDLTVGSATTGDQAGPTTTVPEAWVDGTAEVDPRAAGAAVELLALTTDGLVRVDLADQSLSTYMMETPRPGIDAPVGVFAGADWIVVHRPDTQRADLFEARQSRRQIALATNAQLLHPPGSDTFLTVQQTGMSESATIWTVRSVPFDGSDPLAETVFAVPGSHWVQSVDADGQALLVAPSAGGVYRVAADGASQRLSTGKLLAFDSATLVVADCGETLVDCHAAVVDRATGASTPVPKAIGAPSTFDAPFGGPWGMLRNNLSPTAEYAAVFSAAPDRWSFGLLALRTGEFIPLYQPDFEPTIAWSPDGRFAFYVDNGKLNAYDTVDRVMIPDVSPSLSRVIAFTTRSSA